MSLDTLKEDLKQNLAALAAIKLDPESNSNSVEILFDHLKGTLWPTIEAVVDELAEMDEAIGDIVTNAEDILQPETAEVFAAVIAGGAVIVAALKARITRETDAQLFRSCEEFEKNLGEAKEILEDIVIDDGEPLDDEPDDEQEDQ